MPVGQALLAGTEGAAFGFFPILWIVLNAIWVYNLTVVVRALRRAAALLREGQPRPADPGDHHRLLLRRAARGAGRLRHPGRDHRRDADGAGLPAAQGRRGRADRQHRAGRVRCAGDPDRHAGHGRLRREQRPRPDRRHPRLDGRSADPDPRRRRPADPRVRRRRPARRAPDLAAGAGLRRSPSGSRSSSPPTTSRCRSPTSSRRWSPRPRSSLLLRVWTPAEVLAAEPSAASSVRRRARHGRGVPVRARRAVRARAAAPTVRRRRRSRDSRRRRGAGLRAVPRDHRDLLDRQHHRGQGRSSPRSRGPTPSTGPGSTCSTPSGDPVATTTFTFNWLPAAGTLMIIAGIITAVILQISPGRGRADLRPHLRRADAPRSSP